jgi:di/tricarboxylate transporter
MSADIIFVFALIGFAAILMASNRVRFDIVALLVVLALMLSGVLTVAEALSGFGNSVVIMVAGLLVIGEMLDRTGVAAALGDLILKQGGSNEILLLLTIMIGAALLGAVMSSTAVVAIFIPIVLRIAAETNINASRLLLPMSYAALISGMLTLIATAPNLVVNEELKNTGYDGFGFFGFAVVGLVILVVAIVYILLIGRHLLPGEIPAKDPGEQTKRSIFDIWNDFRLDQQHQPLTIEQDSPLAGLSVAEAQLQDRYQVWIIGIMRKNITGEERIAAPSGDSVLLPGDTLLVIGDETSRKCLIDELALTPYPISARHRQRWLWELGGASVLLHPDSGMIGKTLREGEFRKRYQLRVLGLRRAHEPLEAFEDVELAAGDSLFVVGSWSHIHHLHSLHHDFVVLEVPSEQANVVPAYRRMPIGLAILTGMVLLTLFDVVPLVAAVLIAVLAAVATRCLTMEDAYRGIHWSSLVLIAGMLPLADALEKTGGTDIVVNALMTTFGNSSSITMLSVIFFLTAGLSLVLSNTASAVLVAPIAIYAAEALGVSPYPFAVAVIIAASAAYSTPVSTPVVTLVVEPGRYGFLSFIKIGVPLLLLTYVATALVTPLIFPF